MLLADPSNSPELAAPDPEALFAEARHRRRQRRLRVALLAFVVLGAGGGFYGAFGGGSTQLQTEPHIEAAVAARVAHSSGLILERSTRTSNFVQSDSWVDLKTGDQRTVSYSRKRRRISSFAFNYARDVRQPTVDDVATTSVEYATKSWSSQHFYEPVDASRRISILGDPFTARLDFRLLGRATVDGQPVFHLRADYPQHQAVPNFSPAVRAKLDLPTSIDVWISTADFRLVREQTRRNSTVVTTTDFRWLPRTAANLADTELSVPTGFTRRANPPVYVLPAKPPAKQTAPIQTGSNGGVSVTLGANAVVIFDTKHAAPIVRKTLAGRDTSYTCFRATTTGGLTRVVSGQRFGAFAEQVAFQLKTRAPFDGCELSTGYGQRWPAKFGGHDLVEIAFTPAGKRYFADRAAARELALFVRSRKVHEIRREPLASIAGALSNTYKHGVLPITGPAPASPGEIGYAVTSTGVVFADRSTTGRVFSVEVESGRVARQNVKPLGYVF